VISTLANVVVFALISPSAWAAANSTKPNSPHCASAKPRRRLLIRQVILTIEPYALALPPGDDDFRLAVDTALRHLYLSDEIRKIFEQTSGEKAKPSESIKMMYVMSALPD
jgi:ABC-type amino acid transport substrate-binding protein